MSVPRSSDTPAGFTHGEIRPSAAGVTPCSSINTRAVATLSPPPAESPAIATDSGLYPRSSRAR